MHPPTHDSRPVPNPERATQCHGVPSNHSLTALHSLHFLSSIAVFVVVWFVHSLTHSFVRSFVPSSVPSPVLPRQGAAAADSRIAHPSAPPPHISPPHCVERRAGQSIGMSRTRKPSSHWCCRRCWCCCLSQTATTTMRSNRPCRRRFLGLVCAGGDGCDSYHDASNDDWRR